MTARARGRSLFWTIALIFLLTAIIGTLLQALVATAVLKPLEARESKARAELALSSLAVAVAGSPAPPRGAELDTLLESARGSIRPAWVLVRLADGTIQSAPAGRFLRRPETRARLTVIARRPLTHGNRFLGEAEVVRRNWPRPDFFNGPAPLLSLPIAIAVSVIGGLVVVRLLVRRLRAMEVFANRVAAGDLSVRIEDRSGDEIGRIAEQLDRMTERLAAARAELTRTDEERRQLFADITHELATPLTSIRGYAETLSDPSVPVTEDERTRYVHGVLEEARRMDLLIRDLFELARLEAGAVPLATERLDLAALCRNTIERFRARFEKAGVALSWRSPLQEAWTQADGRRMEQVLENLLTNVLRYVPRGGAVEVSLEEGAHRYRLLVTDSGPGIPASELPLVFTRFYRGAGARGDGGSRDQGGSGLGLAIVREIVERHGGSVSAEGASPHGLRIAVEIPRRG